MNTVKMPVECICEFDMKGNIKPTKIKFGDTDGQYAIDVKKVLERDMKGGIGSILGNTANIHSFKCQSIVEGIAIQYKLQYETKDCTWIMFL